jgi:hypothetical protein
MRLDAPAPVLEYRPTRRRLRVGWWFLISTVVLVILGVSSLWLFGRPMDFSTAKEPFHGRFVNRDAKGRILRETVWREGKLVHAWEMATPSRWVNGRLVFDPPQWTQVVKDGVGTITYFDDRGEPCGFASYLRGNFDRGAH